MPSHQLYMWNEEVVQQYNYIQKENQDMKP
jgi:hypothetical protein